MLVISARLRIDPARRDLFMKAARKMMAETWKEPGCNEYVFTADFDDPAVFRIFEEWESEEALAAHFETPHMAEIQEAMAGFGVTDSAVAKYTVSDKGPLSGS